MAYAGNEGNHLTVSGKRVEARAVFGVTRAYRRVRLIALRLSLPSRFARQPLDALLASLTASLATEGSLPRLREVQRDLQFGECIAQKIPYLPNTCLYRALARYAILSSSGVEAAFVMGVDATAADADGHAWVEVAHAPFAEAHDVSRYVVTYRYPPARDGARLSST